MALRHRLLCHLGLWIAATVATSSIALPPEGADRTESDHHGADAAIAVADEIMSSRTRVDMETRNFRVATDVLAEDVLAQLADGLEGAYYTVNKVLDLPIAQTERKVRAFFFEHASHVAMWLIQALSCLGVAEPETYGAKSWSVRHVPMR